MPGREGRGVGQRTNKRWATSSTLMFSLALVSNRLIPICSANFCASVVSTTLELGSSFLFPTEKRKHCHGDVTGVGNNYTTHANEEWKTKSYTGGAFLEKKKNQNVHTDLIFGTRRHSSGWFRVAIVWRWRRTPHSWRRRPQWRHASPCSIWTCRERHRQCLTLARAASLRASRGTRWMFHMKTCRQSESYSCTRQTHKDPFVRTTVWVSVAAWWDSAFVRGRVVVQCCLSLPPKCPAVMINQTAAMEPLVCVTTEP